MVDFPGQDPPDDPDGETLRRDPGVQLMLRAKAGDQAAYNQLVDAWRDRVVELLTHLLPSEEAAEDVAQKVFLRVFKARHAYQPKSRFSVWIFGIVQEVAGQESKRSGPNRFDWPQS